MQKASTVSVLRHLVLYAEHRFRCRLDTHYVAAHQGDPGNELADQLAGEAANGHPLADLQPWLVTLADPAFQQAAAWFWMPFLRSLSHLVGRHLDEFASICHFEALISRLAEADCFLFCGSPHWHH